MVYVQYKNKQFIFHTDLGSQYTSNDLKELCEKFNSIQSFSKKGCPYDNACIESFHSSIKKEEIFVTDIKITYQGWKFKCLLNNFSKVLLFTGRYFRYRKYLMKIYRLQIWAIFHAQHCPNPLQFFRETIVKCYILNI